MSDEYPNLFEKQCDESDRCQDLKTAIEAIKSASEHYQGGLLPVQQDKKERLDEAREIVFDVLSNERSSIAIQLAAKYTRNPEYRDNDPSDPGVINSFEEWQPENNHD